MANAGLMVSDARRQEIYTEMETLRVKRIAKKETIEALKASLEKEREDFKAMNNRLECLLLELAGQQNLF